MTEHEAYLAFSTFPAIGPTRLKLLKEYFGSVKKAWEASRKELKSLSTSTRGGDLWEKFDQHRKTLDFDLYLDSLRKLGIGFVTDQDKDYPERLGEIHDAPFLLYIKGSFSKASPLRVAVVGTRKSTTYGREICEKLVYGLVGAGVTIVSGMALGIDAIAHKAALDCQGFTIGVMGGGLDNIYPASNARLGEEIVKSGRGVLISEYPLGIKPRPEHFPFRNRIVSGLSLGVLVIEGGIKSGTMLTASLSAKQGRDVFAVPGSVFSPTSSGPHMLIRNGAKLVERAEDILEELGFDKKINISNLESRQPETDEEKELLGILGVEPLDIDTIVRISTSSPEVVFATLTNMELKGMVKNTEGLYRKK